MKVYIITFLKQTYDTECCGLHIVSLANNHYFIKISRIYITDLSQEIIIYFIYGSYIISNYLEIS